MSHTVTIEGSLTPSVNLLRGERRTVTVTREVRDGVARGYWNVVEGSLDAPATVVEPPAAPTPPAETDGDGHGDGPDDDGVPARNASRKVWAAFLDNQTPPIPYPVDAGRDDLIAGWDAIQQQRHGGS